MVDTISAGLWDSFSKKDPTRPIISKYVLVMKGSKPIAEIFLYLNLYIVITVFEPAKGTVT